METQAKELLGTRIELTLPDPTFFSSCFDELQRIEKTYSRFLKESILSQLNQHIGEWVSVTKELFWLLQKAEELKKRSLGNFDITIKKALDNTGYDADYSFQQKTVQVLPVNKPVLFDEKKLQVCLPAEIDLGGLGKGFALDTVGELLEQKKVASYFLNAGGDILAKGSWNVLLEHPDDSSRAIGEVTLENKAIACSSPNRRKWKNMHHLINAKTLKPSTEVKTAWVIADTALEADAFATVLTVASFEEAQHIAEKEQLNTLIVSNNNKMFLSKHFSGTLYA